MPNLKTALHARPHQPSHAGCTTVKPGQFDIQIIHHLRLRAVFEELMHMRELRERPVKQNFTKPPRWIKNVVPKSEHNRQHSKHRHFHPRLATDSHIRAVPQHANMFLLYMQQPKAAWIPKEREHHLARRVDCLSKDKFHSPLASSIQPPHFPAARA